VGPGAARRPTAPSLHGGRFHDAYNVALALRRAVRVKVLLIGAGMAADRIQTGARGDRDAVGDDMKYSYGYDRRVDALVAVVHAPAAGR
jgi:outer membrane protein OmpA-like peptidoglycan-associated protein